VAGLKVMLMVHVADGATLEGQLLVCEKSPGFAPAMLMLLIARGWVPAFVSVTICGELVVPVA
jgi:hypothetical protein